MADKAPSATVATTPSGETASLASTKKGSVAKARNPRPKPVHPKTAEMVNAAIVALKERGGSSLQAIKKYMVGTYKVDSEKQAIFIKKYLKAAVASGALIQTKGKGAAGSFKLATTKRDPSKPKAKPVPKPKVSKKAPAAKKLAAVKKPTVSAAKKAPAKKTTTTAVSPKKKPLKGPAAKPPKAKITKAKSTAKSPVKKSKPVAVKKSKPDATKPKKAAPKRAVASKK